jgi:hypothetical protein
MKGVPGSMLFWQRFQKRLFWAKKVIFSFIVIIAVINVLKFFYLIITLLLFNNWYFSYPIFKITKNQVILLLSSIENNHISVLHQSYFVTITIMRLLKLTLNKISAIRFVVIYSFVVLCCGYIIITIIINIIIIIISSNY